MPKYGKMVKRAAVHRQRFNGASGNYNGFGRAASNNNPGFIWHTHANVQPGLCEGLEQQPLSGERLPEICAGSLQSQIGTAAGATNA